MKSHAQKESNVGRFPLITRWSVALLVASSATILAGTPLAPGAFAQSTSSSGKSLGPALPPATTRPAAPATLATTPRTTTPPRVTAPTVPPKTTSAVNRSTKRVVRTTKRPAAKSPAKSSASGIGQGSRGDQVLAIQTRLQELKYDISTPDGQFGNQTWHAVLAFQKVNGLGRTARVNAATLAALQTATDPAPLLPDGGADRIEIDIKRQFLAIYRGGELSRILSISSGNNKPYCGVDPDTKKKECDVAVTPGGSFRAQSRITGFRESKLGLLYNPVYFNGGIAIHGSPSVPGYPASHGCVRIPMSSSEWFVSEVPEKMPIYVFDGKATPKALSGTANPLPGGSVPQTPGTPTTVSPAAVTTTTQPGIARILTTAPSTSAPSSSVAPQGSSTAVATVPIVAAAPSSTVPGATTVPPASTTTVQTTQGTVPIISG